jgi:phospholipid/cholesterol/gamma-HCH transport system ATP-binding protein
MHTHAEAVPADAIIRVEDLTMAFGGPPVQKDLNFGIERGSVFSIIGGSGCGKSTLLRHMIGLQTPTAGRISLDTRTADKRFGVLFQGGALWSSMTLAENLETVLQLEHRLSRAQLREIVHYKLSLVGLSRFAGYYPAEISGGMRKRAALARALVLDPELLFLDEPSAGLDPLSARQLDDLILQLRDTLETTVVLVTHELDSIYAIVDRAVFLDTRQRTATALGSPAWLRDECPDEHVRAFMRRGAPKDMNS